MAPFTGYECTQYKSIAVKKKNKKKKGKNGDANNVKLLLKIRQRVAGFLGLPVVTGYAILSYSMTCAFFSHTNTSERDIYGFCDA